MTSVALILQGHPDWPATLEVLAQLRAAGHRALLAGGCVRDALLGRAPQDLDIASSATPSEVITLFPKTVEVGKAFGVVRVLHRDSDLEVATFREDGPSADGRRPESVVFSDDRKDAQRRDFTVNALFFDPQTDEVLDHVGGIGDLAQHCLRTVGDPSQRFKEDHLRLLRALRFAVQLDFEIDPRTWSELQKFASLVQTVSGERVRDELWKLLRWGRGKRAIFLLESSGLWKALFPELDLSNPEVQSRVSRLLREPPFERADAFTRLFLEWAPVMTSTILPRLKLSKSEYKSIETRWRWVRDREAFWELPQGRRLRLFADEDVGRGLTLGAERDGGDLRLESLREEWAKMGDLPEALLKGDDVKTQLQGPQIRELLDEAYERQLEGVFSDRDAALTWFSDWLKLRSQENS